MSSQPFWLRWRDGDDRSRRHAPDFFARRADGTAVVVDVRPDDRIPATGRGDVRGDGRGLRGRRAGSTGRSGDLDPVLVANVRWLSRYRHRRCLVPEVAAVLLEAFAGGRGLFEGAELAGDRLRVLPVLFHLMWQRQLAADLAVPLGMSTVVRAGGAGERRAAAGSGSATGSWPAACRTSWSASPGPGSGWPTRRARSARPRSPSWPTDPRFEIPAAGPAAGAAAGDRAGGAAGRRGRGGVLVGGAHRRGRLRAAAGRACGDAAEAAVRPGAHQPDRAGEGEGRRAVGGGQAGPGQHGQAPPPAVGGARPGRPGRPPGWPGGRGPPGGPTTGSSTAMRQAIGEAADASSRTAGFVIWRTREILGRGRL